MNNGCVYGFKVTKTHNFTHALQFSNKPNVLIFLSARHGEKIDERFDFYYIADTNLVKKRGETVIFEYQNMFSLSDEQMELLLEYFHYWDILRQCCGSQMSNSWRP